MVKIDKISWGKVRVNDKDYHQVLIVGDRVLEREKPKLELLFGTTHVIGDWEQQELFSENPEVILIANGWNGVLKVSQKLKVKSQKLAIELRIVNPPQVVAEYNRLAKQGKRVNALIHTTC